MEATPALNVCGLYWRHQPDDRCGAIPVQCRAAHMGRCRHTSLILHITFPLTIGLTEGVQQRRRRVAGRRWAAIGGGGAEAPEGRPFFLFFLFERFELPYEEDTGMTPYRRPSTAAVRVDCGGADPAGPAPSELVVRESI